MNISRPSMTRSLRHAVFAPLITAALAMPARPAALLPQAENPQAVPSPNAADPRPTSAPIAGELPFTKLPYAEARAAAREQGKLFVVDATATWCVPCKQMEREAWPVAEVGTWLTAHAIAVQVDVDKQKDIALELKIEALPTIIVFGGDTELDRREGAQKANELVSWLDDVAAGRAGHSPLIARGLELLQSDDVQARFDIARELLHHGEPALALKHYLWLWPNTRETPKLFGVRVSFMLTDMKRLADADDDARESVFRLFEEVRGKVIHTDTPDEISWLEFTSWCSTFGHEDQPIDWYDRHHDPDGSVHLPVFARTSLLGLLIAQQRWTDAGRLGDLPALAEQKLASYRDARTRLRNDTDLDPRQRRDRLQGEQAGLGRTLAQLSAAAWAAGHDEVGRELARSLLTEIDDADSRIVLVQTTLDAVGAQPEQRTWIEEAATLGGDPGAIANLRKSLRKKLEEQAAAAAPPQPESAPESGR